MPFEVIADAVEGFVHGIRKLQQAEFMLVDGAGAHHVFPVEDAVPIFSSVDQDQVAPVQFSGLLKRDLSPRRFKGPEPAGKKNSPVGNLGNPQLGKKKIMEKKP